MKGIDKKYKSTKLACYFAGFSMSAASNISALLFITFHDLYGISFTALGFLVLVNFCTQLGIDLVFTFFSDKFNLERTIKNIPLLVLAGLAVYIVIPSFIPEFAYAGLLIGTAIFSVGAVLGEVLTSPIVAAIPSDNPEGEMSKLHSAYAWGTVFVVIVSTAFLKLAGRENWMYLVLLWCIIPFVCYVLFAKSQIPELNLHDESGEENKKDFGIILCTACIFFGGAAECTMMQWVSGFAENALNIQKTYGDIFGMAFFALMLGIGRTLYSKKGKSIYPVLLFGMGSAAICYVVAALSQNAVIGLLACAFAGLCTSMLWPGTIIYTNSNYLSCGVGIYALLAAGGDLGASLSPQLVGIVADMSGLKNGMLTASLFPIAGFFLLIITHRYFKNKTK